MNTRSKFLFYGGNDYQDEGGLMTHIAEDILPDFLGGTCAVCRATFKAQFLLTHNHHYFCCSLKFLAFAL